MHNQKQEKIPQRAPVKWSKSSRTKNLGNVGQGSQTGEGNSKE